MPLTLTVPDEIVRAAAVVAHARGVSVEELLLQTLREAFLQENAPSPLAPDKALAAEIAAWNAASDEDFAQWSEALEQSSPVEYDAVKLETKI